MQNESNVSLDERIERVHVLDLGPILQLMYPERRIVPSKEVDAFWHAHILDTFKYAADCEHVLGRFLHQFPYFGLRGESDA